MREYDLKKALSTGSYTRNSIKPQLLVAEDGEYRQGDILDANATMEVVSSTASDIDDKINDILGVDNGAVQELVGILSDSDTTTGILNELAKKANISDLETVAGDIPQVPTNVSAFTNDAGYLTQHQDISGKANSSDLSTVATSGSYNDLSNKPNLANVATSGSYEDLSNKPHIPEDPVQSDWTEDDTTDQAYIKNKPNLATVATSGSYNDLIDKPAAVEQVQSDWLEADITDPAYIKNKPNIPNALIQSDWAQDDNTLADYIKNKPIIPAEQIQSDWNQSDTTAKDYIKNKPSNATQSQSGLMSSADKTKLDGLSTVATTGSYNDLTDKPTIPTKVSDLTNNLDLLQRPHSSNGHEYVEIGGIKWATMNVGASSETDKGLYFAWGETEGYRIYADNSQNTRDFSESEYKYAELDGSTYVYTKYNSTDGKSSLDIEDDAARANWGGNWRIPTRDEFSNLFVNCIATIVRDSNDSPIGFLFTDKTDSTKSIYFPGCRGRKDGVLHDRNFYNSLPIWTNQRYDLSDYSYDDIAWIVAAGYETTNGVDTPHPNSAETAFRYSGRPIRAILDEPTPSNTASKVAVTGDYNDLINKPTIPTKLSDLTNDSDYTQLPQDNFFEGHEYVDLGLPSGTLWAKCNVGASSEVGYGTYFKYGLNRFVASDATYTGTENPLSSSADAATIRWGNSWCSPTETLYRELVDNTTPEICKINGVDGTKYTAANGKYIFFPHGGRGYTDTISYRNMLGAYWTSTPCSISGRELSEAVSFGTGTAADGIGNSDRNYGFNIRPVISSSAQVTPVRFLREDGTWTNVVSETIRIINLTQSITDETTNISGTSNDCKRETVIYNNTSQNDYTVSISTAYKTVDGNQMVLSVPAGCYGEVCYTNIGGTIFAKGIKQLANS